MDARVVESLDTADLSSADLKGRVGWSPTSGTNPVMKQMIQLSNLAP